MFLLWKQRVRPTPHSGLITWSVSKGSEGVEPTLVGLDYLRRC